MLKSVNMHYFKVSAAFLWCHFWRELTISCVCLLSKGLHAAVFHLACCFWRLEVLRARNSSMSCASSEHNQWCWSGFYCRLQEFFSVENAGCCLICRSVSGFIWRFSVKGGCMFCEAFICCINNHCLVVLKESELSAKKVQFHMSSCEHIWGIVGFNPLFI